MVVCPPSGYVVPLGLQNGSSKAYDVVWPLGSFDDVITPPLQSQTIVDISPPDVTEEGSRLLQNVLLYDVTLPLASVDEDKAPLGE
jgi:hypothetical protein